MEAQSSSTILTAPFASARRAPVIFDKFAKKRSDCSFRRSPTTSTVTTSFRCPGRKATVLLTGLKSDRAAALPLEVAK